MKEFHAPDKVTQQMTRDGLTELNKATGAAGNISARDAPAENVQNSGGEALNKGGEVIDRVKSEYRAHRNKKTVKRFNKEIRRTKGEPSRLQFTAEERADPALSKAIGKSDRAADKVDAARARLPKQKELSIQRVFDEPTGKAKTRLSFRDTEKPLNGKLQHNLLSRPKQEAALAAHGEVERSNADGNIGVQAAHFAERRAEGAARKVQSGYRSLKTRPYRAAAKAEKSAAKANVNALYQKALRADPELAKGNILQKSLYKRKIKRDYAKAFRQGNIQTAKKTAATIKKTAQKATETAQKTAAFAVRHWKGLAVVGASVLLLVLLFGGLSSCGSMLSGGFNAIIGTSYTAEDNDITGVDGSYTALETALRNRIANITNEFPGYDEYRISVDEIGHDPFELASYLTALFNSYIPAEAQAELNRVFNQQYTLTITPVTEVRYRTEERTGSYTDAEGNEHSYTYTVEVPYNYYILNVTLRNHSLGSVAAANLTPEQKKMYDIYMETQGNKPYLFEDNPYVNRGAYTDYDIPPDALTDTKFAAMIQEAEKYLGYPYVWGGSSPATSFDCSGFVSWVVNHSGWNMGRLTATGLMNQCAIIPPSEAKPGDLIFFQGTYDTAGASHVGIYVGGGMMIHCGNPISYASVTTTYWTNHFYCYGRLP
jgi:cell wall-associated NlpC family hydrolase